MILFTLIFAVSLFGQSITEGQDVSNSNGNYIAYSNTDSCFFDDDTLYICGAETAYVFVAVRNTKGMITFKGNKARVMLSPTSDKEKAKRMLWPGCRSRDRFDTELPLGA